MRALLIVLISAIPFVVGAHEEEDRGRFYVKSDPISILRLVRAQPRSAYTNPGFPVDNPPKKVVLSNGDNTIIPLISKYGEFDPNGPVWTDKSDIPSQRVISPKLFQEMKNEVMPQEPIAKAPVSEGKGIPNSCVWAIISCCSAATNNVNYNCFEQLGCVGSFWGSSPCDSDFAHAAISNAMNYYQAV
ncbi:uncharacterized protein LOC116167347 [Photinus pyralis]|uniref:Uncharacterized protein n=1 Tax=Photinus pyralis TaxID=7054 RepID=A0A1Y1K6J1_PHOPY|nr:uncharacterized protein LOC116167347 [Photinus pyralis]